MRRTEFEETLVELVLDRNRLRINCFYIHREIESIGLVKKIMSRENGNGSILFPYFQ